MKANSVHIQFTQTSTSKHRQTFRKVKTLEAAKKVIAGFDRETISIAWWYDDKKRETLLWEKQDEA